MYGKCGICKYGDRYADGWCERFASKPDDIGGDCEGDCPYFNTTVSVPVEHGVRRTCQRIRYETGNLCRSGKKTKAYNIIADREAYVLINVKVYLCPKCAEEMGV